MLCLCFHSFKLRIEDSFKVDDISRADQLCKEFDKWDIAQNFLITDPYKTLSELQHLIKNQTTSKQLLVKPVFEKLQLLSKNQNFANIPLSLRIISDLLYSLINYIEGRKTLKKKKKVAEQPYNNDDLGDITQNRKNSETYSVDEEDQIPNEMANNSYRIGND